MQVNPGMCSLLLRIRPAQVAGMLKACLGIKRTTVQTDGGSACQKRILYVQYTNPGAYPPLEHSSRILADRGWAVRFVGIAAEGVSELVFAPHERIEVRLLRMRPAGFRQKLHYGVYCLWVLQHVIRWRPRWIYASETLACPPAMMAAMLLGTRVIYHEHDSPVNPPSGFLVRLYMWSRKRLAMRADACILPNQVRAEEFAKKTAARKVTVVWNCPRPDEVGPQKASEDSGRICVHYHGNISRTLLPEALVRALPIVPSTVTLRIVGYETSGSKGYGSSLKSLAEKLGAGDRIEILKPAPRYRLLELCRTGDIGLALMPTTSTNLNMRALVGASNKVFDYMSSGLALLVSDIPEWCKEYVEPGYGLCCDPEDPTSIAAQLSWFLTNPETVREMGERGRRQILSDWNYEGQFAGIVKTLEAAVAG